MCRAAQLSEHFRLLNKPFTQCYYFQLCHKLTNSRIIWATLPSGLDKKYRSQSRVKGNILIISLIEWALILSLSVDYIGADGWIYVALKRRTQEHKNTRKRKHNNRPWYEMHSFLERFFYEWYIMFLSVKHVSRYHISSKLQMMNNNGHPTMVSASGKMLNVLSK